MTFLLSVESINITKIWSDTMIKKTQSLVEWVLRSSKYERGNQMSCEAPVNVNNLQLLSLAINFLQTFDEALQRSKIPRI